MTVLFELVPVKLNSSNGSGLKSNLLHSYFQRSLRKKTFGNNVLVMVTETIRSVFTETTRMITGAKTHDPKVFEEIYTLIFFLSMTTHTMVHSTTNLQSSNKHIARHPHPYRYQGLIIDRYLICPFAWIVDCG
jgi:hypothetical protein